MKSHQLSKCSFRWLSIFTLIFIFNEFHSVHARAHHFEVSYYVSLANRMKLMSAFRCVYLRKMATQGSLKRNNKMKRNIRVLDRTRHSQNTTKYCRNGLRMKIGIQHFGSAVLPLILIRYRNERVFASIRNHIMGRPK